MACALGPFIQKAYAVVRQRHLAWQRHLPPTDQAHIGDGVMGGAKRARRNEGGTVAGEAGNTMHAGCVDGLRRGHIGQDRREASCQPHWVRERSSATPQNISQHSFPRLAVYTST
jgi:hypothetical protein